MEKNNQKVYPIIFLLLSTITLVSLRWTTSFFFFPSEPLVNKVIFDLAAPGDQVYFAYILNMANFDFNPDYLEDYVPKKIIPLPIYSLIFHSITYLISGEYSFVIIEYFSIFLFLYIFSKILRELNINIYFSIIFALGVFLLPDFVLLLKQLKINFINLDIIKNLYSFRIPRPIISNIYFFWGLLLAIYFHKYRNNNYFFILIGINLALNFGSVFYNFVTLSVLFFILFLYEYLKSEKDFFLYFIKKVFITIIFFFIFSLPFIIILFFSEEDYLLRVGAFYPSFDQRKILLSYILLNFLSFKFLLTIFVNTFFLFFLLKKQNFFCKKTIVVLYLFFISSCISPILFVSFSPTFTEIYHFIDLIVVTGILLFFIFIILILAIILRKNIKIYKYYNSISKNSFYSLLLILLLSITHNINYFLSYDKNKNFDFRKDINILYNYLNQNNNNQKLDNILTFDNRIQVWWLFLGKDKFSTIHSNLTSLKTQEHELNFIENLKFLKISKKNFGNIIANKKVGYRYTNKYVRYFSTYTYQANSLITYKNSKSFENKILKFINNTSPLYTQQHILPEEEIKRLMNLFNKTNNSIFENPDIIILNKNSLIKKYSSININNYCKLKHIKYLVIYLNLDKVSCDL